MRVVELHDCLRHEPGTSTGHAIPMSKSNINNVKRRECGRLIYPDVLHERFRNGIDGDLQLLVNNDDSNESTGSDNEAIANVFFELANATEILYRVRHRNAGSSKAEVNGQYLTFQQDMGACSRHTGGIVWETSYLLLEYLLELQRTSLTKTFCLGRTCELGAGVGFLGQCLVAEHVSCTPTFILTETAEVVTNLQKNVRQNQSKVDMNLNCTLSVSILDWTRFKEDIERSNGTMQPHSFDTLLGTDVIFTTQLVEPLLQTAEYLSHDQTIWFLCVQIRCAAAHQMFLDTAPMYGFYVEDISSECFCSPACRWGEAMDCFLFRISRKSNKA